MKTPPRTVRTDPERAGSKSATSDICLDCKAPLSGKQSEFCSPRCKAKWHHQERRRLARHLSITAAAAELGISRYAVYRAIRSARLQAVQVATVGRPRLEVTRGELERYQAGRPVRRRRLRPEEMDAEIRRAVGEMARKVREIGSRL